MNKREQEEWDSQARRAVLRRKKYNKPWKSDPLSDPMSPKGEKGNGEYWLKNGWTGESPEAAAIRVADDKLQHLKKVTIGE